jgi:hypothetical protein
VRPDGGDLAFESNRSSFDPSRDARRVLTLQLRRRPHLSIEPPPGGGEFRVTLIPTRGSAYEVTEAVTAGQPVPVPAADSFVIVAWDKMGRTVRHRVDSLATAARPLRLPAFPAPPVVRGRLVDAEGAPVRGAVAWDRWPEGRRPCGRDGRFELKLDDRGTGRLPQLHVFPAAGLDVRARTVEVALPAGGQPAGGQPAPGQTVELGDLTLSPTTTPPLRVLQADGEPAAAAPARFFRASRGQARRPTADGGGTLAADGGWDGVALRAGDTVVIDLGEPTSTDTECVVPLPLREKLQSEGPWVLRAPAGEVVVQCVDESGAPVHPHLAVPGLVDPVHAERDRTRLRNVPAGWHRIVAFAAGRRAGVAQFELEAGQRRTLRLVLPREPAAPDPGDGPR